MGVNKGRCYTRLRCYFLKGSGFEKPQRQVLKLLSFQINRPARSAIHQINSSPQIARHILSARMPTEQNYVDRNTPMGATLISGGVTFRVFAPAAREMYLLTGASLVAAQAP